MTEIIDEDELLASQSQEEFESYDEIFRKIEIEKITAKIEEKLVQQNGSIPIAIPEEEITTENPQMEFLPHLDAEQRDVEFDVDEFLSEISRSHLCDLYLYI